jgi:hypothetical protein
MLVSRFFMSTDVIAHLLRLSGPKMVMACTTTAANWALFALMLRHTPIFGNRLPEFYSFCMHKMLLQSIRTARSVS